MYAPCAVAGFTAAPAIIAPAAMVSATTVVLTVRMIIILSFCLWLSLETSVVARSFRGNKRGRAFVPMELSGAVLIVFAFARFDGTFSQRFGKLTKLNRLLFV
jgi:hypothetical protein